MLFAYAFVERISAFVFLSEYTYLEIMASLSNKVFAITGGASGMGLATGLRLARANVRAICIGDFNAQTLDGARDQILAANSKTEVLTTKIDVSSSSSVQGWINDIIEKFGTLDGAVNCAGVAQKVMARKSPTILEETDETWERTIGVNLNGVFFSTRAEVQAMVKLDKAPRSIVNIASMASMVHGPDCYAYGVSKRAVASLSTSVSKDVLPFGIRVNTVSPCMYPTVSYFLLSLWYIHSAPNFFAGLRKLRKPCSRKVKTFTVAPSQLLFDPRSLTHPVLLSALEIFG